MKNTILLLVVCLCVVGCQRYIPSEEIEVELVVEHDGIKVYRFWDGRRIVYFTDARGKIAWEEIHSTGKIQRREQREVETIR